MKPPIGLGLDYARYLRSRLEVAGEALISAAVQGWDPDRGRVPRTRREDASAVDKAVRALVTVLEDHPPDPAKVTSVGVKVERSNAKQIKAMGLPVPGDPRMIPFLVTRGKGEEKKEHIIYRGSKGKALGLPGVPTVPSPKTEAFRDENLSLIKTLDTDTVSRFRGILEQADREAWRVEDLRGKLEEELGVSKRHADLLARDQVLKFNAQLTESRQTAAGVTHYEWSTSGDERVRPAHAELDGTIQAWADPPVVDEKEDRRCHPGEDYQCRCIAIPILD